MKKIMAGGNVVLSDDDRNEMLARATEAYGKFLEALGYDWKNDPNMIKTPYRVAKMFVNEITSGAYSAPPKLAVFPSSGYSGMVIEHGIEVNSLCSHHYFRSQDSVVWRISAKKVAKLSVFRN